MLHRLPVLVCWLLTLTLASPMAVAVAQAIAPANSVTIVTPQGNQFDISGGTAAGRNLFHSFQRLGLGPNQIANFLATPGIENILGRVVGGEPSIINGRIQVSGGPANLYLINPAGIVFGPLASLNVPASFTATTASAIGFGNDWGVNFARNLWWGTGELPGSPPDYSQWQGAPSAVAFRSGQSGAILNAGTLTVSAGQGLALLGGTVINTGMLSAPSGRITLVAVAGDKLLRLDSPDRLLSLDLPISTAGLGHPAIAPLSLPQLLTGGMLPSATGVTLENGLVKLTAGNLPISTSPGVLTVGGQISASGLAVGLGGQNSGLNSGLYPDGGTVRLWSTGSTQILGQVIAQGRDLGRGGVVETLGVPLLMDPAATVDASAASGNGGTWILPMDTTIASDGSGVSPASLVASLARGTNITLTTSGIATGSATLPIISGLGTESLTLTAGQFWQTGEVTLDRAGGALVLSLYPLNFRGIAFASPIKNPVALGGDPRRISGGAALGTGAAQEQSRTLNQALALNGATPNITNFFNGSTLNESTLNGVNTALPVLRGNDLRSNRSDLLSQMVAGGPEEQRLEIALDASFGREFVEQFGLPPVASVPLPQVQEMLRRVNREFGVKTAIIYAFFTPKAMSSVVGPSTAEADGAANAADGGNPGRCCGNRPAKTIASI